MPRVVFGFCYILPCDSKYYSHEFFAAVQERIKSGDTCSNDIIMGDMNARFGKSVRELLPVPQLNNVCPLLYPVLSDDVNVPNDNAEILATICKDNKMVVINSLKTPQKHFISNKIYRKRGTLISELDTCIVSLDILDSVSDFHVLQHNDLTSDHAITPITMTITTTGADLRELLERASHFGDHSVLHNKTRTRYVKKA